MSSEGVQNFLVKIAVNSMKQKTENELKAKRVKSVANGWTECECGDLLDLRSNGKRRREIHEARQQHTVPFHLYLRANLPRPSNGCPCLQINLAAKKIIRQAENVEKKKTATQPSFYPTL